MDAHRFPIVLVVAALLLSSLLIHPPEARPASAAQAEACFAETGFCIRGRFLDYWTINGGLARNGYPLSEERREILEDGNEYTVQYFERVRLELHPENQPPYDVLLGQFGRRAYRSRYSGTPQPVSPIPGQLYFEQTGHNLGGRFLEYWEANGGLAQFGYPITEEYSGEPLEDGRTYRVQYFERARFELHPENQAPYDVLLGQFGRQILAENDLLTDDFRPLYITNEGVREALGAPGRVQQAQGVTQAFERGRMFWRGDTRRIYVFCGDPETGRLLGSFLTGPSFPDTWEEGQDPGGGPGSQPGLYEPKRGFGKLWREGFQVGPSERIDVRDCLGYALTPDEQVFPFVLQPFGRGFMLAGPDGRSIYVVSIVSFGNGGFSYATYTRYEGRSR